jgi:predicted O-linked N-acetylglucosamine transferase (SPINDLY family)
MGIPERASVSATFGDLSKLSVESGYIQALSEILKRFPNHYHLFSGPGDIRAIRAYLHAEGVLTRVRFMGNMSDVSQLVAISDLYMDVFPDSDPRWSGEARSAGKPVVTLGDSKTVAGYIDSASQRIRGV